MLLHVELVDLSSNSFYGEISGWDIVLCVHCDAYEFKSQWVEWWVLSGGFYFFSELGGSGLSYNLLTGSLPTFGSLPYLQVLRLGNNRFTGTIPEKLLESSVPLVELDRSVNEVTALQVMWSWYQAGPFVLLYLFHRLILFDFPKETVRF